MKLTTGIVSIKCGCKEINFKDAECSNHITEEIELVGTHGMVEATVPNSS